MQVNKGNVQIKQLCHVYYTSLENEFLQLSNEVSHTQLGLLVQKL